MKCALMIFTPDETVIKELVYIVRGASKLFLGVPAIRSRGLIHGISGIYSVKAVHTMPSPSNSSLRSEIKEDVVKQYLMLFEGLGSLEGEHTIQGESTPCCLTASRRE